MSSREEILELKAELRALQVDNRSQRPLKPRAHKKINITDDDERIIALQEADSDDYDYLPNDFDSDAGTTQNTTKQPRTSQKTKSPKQPRTSQKKKSPKRHSRRS